MNAFKVLQHWECCILDVNKEDVEVMMVDITANGSLPDEYATIDKGKFTVEQQRYLIPGYIFDWKIGHYPDHPVHSIFEFKPLQVFTKEDIDQAAKKAEELFNFFNGGDQ